MTETDLLRFQEALKQKEEAANVATSELAASQRDPTDIVHLDKATDALDRWGLAQMAAEALWELGRETEW